MIRALIAALTKLIALFGFSAWLRHDAAKDARMEADNAADRRMDEADLGIGATDGERRERLRDLGVKWKRG